MRCVKVTKLKKEVFDRLLLAKSILAASASAVLAKPNPFTVAVDLLRAHDAADLVFAAIIDQQRKMPPGNNAPSMMSCLGLIDATVDKSVAYFRALSDARDGLKHVGNLPNTTQWERVASDTFDKLTGVCRSTLGVSLTGLDESELLTNDEVRAHFTEAKNARDAGKFRGALEEVGKALVVALNCHPNLWGISVGEPKAEDALKLGASGISASDFLQLQEFLPAVSRFSSDPFKVAWKQSGFGHPANWRAEVAGFCVTKGLAVALGVQAASVTPSAFEFEFVYGYRVTAKHDGVEVWEDLVEGQMEETYAENSRPFRNHKRYLNNGESITVSGFAKPLVSDDFSLEGEWIKRVRVSDGDFSSLFPRARAEFVNLRDVEIMCVPRFVGQGFDELPEYMRNLPEIPWVDDAS